jgi:hypothetical protein
VKISEFISTLPNTILTGDSIVIPDDFIRKMFSFSNLNKDDVFYHLGIGNNPSTLRIAIEEFKVKKAVGIDINDTIIDEIKSKTKNIKNAYAINENVTSCSLSEATVIFSWFTDEKISKSLSKKFESELDSGSRIISIWSPPALYLPDKIDFPILVCEKPFKIGVDIKDQLKAIYKTDCIDFTAAWNLADRYIKSFGTVDLRHHRFLNILQSLIIWFNARDLGIACENEIPPPVKSYVEILKYFFNIDLTDFYQSTVNL